MAQSTLMLIADIGGYTRFMKVHRLMLAHAQDLVGRLLESIIDAGEPKLKVAKLEGDAVFFYAQGDSAEDLGERVQGLRKAFLRQRQQLEMDRICSCDACVQVGELKLKFVAHRGEVAIQKVKRFQELAGVDVILVHRLLKNAVPVPEYVLMTDPVLETLAPELRQRARQHSEDLEGLGPTPVHYLDLGAFPLSAEALKPSWPRRISAFLGMNLRTLPASLGKPCSDFRNIHEASGGAPTATPS